MASLRKASSYSKRRARPFTRKSRTKKKAFIKTVPGIKVTKFNMGEKRAFNEGKYKYEIKMLADEYSQFRDNSIEACRMLVNKILDKEIPGQYYFAIKVYPHHMMRENKKAAGAGADRLSSGMKHSYGVVIGRAALVHKGKELFVVAVGDEKGIKSARKALAKIRPKVPCKTKMTFTEIKR